MSTFEPMATTLLRARVDRRQAAAAKKILAGLGLKPGDAVGMLLAQVVAHRGLPFPVQEEGYAYARAEYGLTPREVDAAESRIVQSMDKARKSGSVRRVNSADDLR